MRQSAQALPCTVKSLGPGLSLKSRRALLVYAETLVKATLRKKHWGELTPKHVDVLRVLLFKFFNGPTGECYPSMATIAEAAGCCRQTVRDAVERLQALGLLTYRRRYQLLSVVPAGSTSRHVVALRASNVYGFAASAFRLTRSFVGSLKSRFQSRTTQTNFLIKEKRGANPKIDPKIPDYSNSPLAPRPPWLKPLV